MATKRQGVGIWEHYRTTDRADGFEFRGHVNGHRVHAKLYWAPADFRRPDECGRRPYVVVTFDGTMNAYGRYEDELRVADYVGEERPRRNWRELCGIAEKIDEAKIAEWIDGKLELHELWLELGGTFSNGAYYYPQGVTPAEFAETFDRALNERKVA